ncbi:HNH endonuclease [Streptosporangium sp. NPDC000239]|uniref:HNH endonuclease n=1 Tax=Streptosporangium sp. NPDC000239 TaxID=3154248 RepID=UPI00331F11E6
MPKKKQKTAPRQNKQKKGVGIYHDMAVYENFERCAHRVFKVLQLAQKSNPGAPRLLYFDVQGHRNDAGGYDHDSLEIMKQFFLEYLMSYLTEISTPLYRAKNGSKQRNDIPDELAISYPEGESGFWYDIDLLPVSPRETDTGSRRTPPSRKAIADYLGMDEELCLVCWKSPIERAHAVPTALGGSMNVRNFALLCKEHHSQAPDIADAEAFWAWVDYAERRDAGSKWERSSEDIKDWVRALGSRTEMQDRSEMEFIAAVKFELRNLYGWTGVDFSDSSWSLQEEYHRVLDAATGKHFGVEKKVATHAWAYDVAKRRLSLHDPSRTDQPKKVLLYEDIQ